MSAKVRGSRFKVRRPGLWAEGLARTRTQDLAAFVSGSRGIWGAFARYTPTRISNRRT